MLKYLTTLVLTALVCVPLQAQEIIETRLGLDDTKLVVQDLGNGKISTRVTFRPTLISSNHTSPTMTGELKISAQLGVWMQNGSRMMFHYLESSRPQVFSTTERGTIEESLFFSKDELISARGPICLQLIASTRIGSSEAGTSKVVCTGSL